MKRIRFSLVIAIACATLRLGSATAADWGELKGTFVLKGGVPKAKAIAVTKDIPFCGKHKLVDESLVVGADGGVKNIVVYMYLKTGAAKPAIHPDYVKTAKSVVSLDNKGCRFEPHVVLLRTTQTLKVGNPDAVGHNTKVDFLGGNTSFNDLIPAGKSLDKQFSEAERLPTQVSCSIHPWMTAWVVVKDNPYFAVTDDKGSFTIKNVPAGEWTFQFWHEKAGYVQDVTVGGKTTKWSRGRLDVKVASGKATDLGKVTLAPKVFEK